MKKWKARLGDHGKGKGKEKKVVTWADGGSDDVQEADSVRKDADITEGHGHTNIGRITAMKAGITSDFASRREELAWQSRVRESRERFTVATLPLKKAGGSAADGNGGGDIGEKGMGLSVPEQQDGIQLASVPPMSAPVPGVEGNGDCEESVPLEQNLVEDSVVDRAQPVIRERSTVEFSPRVDGVSGAAELSTNEGGTPVETMKCSERVGDPPTRLDTTGLFESLNGADTCISGKTGDSSDFTNNEYKSGMLSGDLSDLTDLTDSLDEGESEVDSPPGSQSTKVCILYAILRKVANLFADHATIDWT
jgi:hypothetical protein